MSMRSEIPPRQNWPSGFEALLRRATCLMSSLKLIVCVTKLPYVRCNPPADFSLSSSTVWGDLSLDRGGEVGTGYRGCGCARVPGTFVPITQSPHTISCGVESVPWSLSSISIDPFFCSAEPMACTYHNNPPDFARNTIPRQFLIFSLQNKITALPFSCEQRVRVSFTLSTALSFRRNQS
jgi:hypothetical protein